MYNLLENLDIHLSDNQIKLFNSYIELFKEYNQNINLISKNDLNVLFEKHIFDSLSINLFFKKYGHNLVSPTFFDDSSSPKNWGSPFQGATQKFRSRSLSRNFLGQHKNNEKLLDIGTGGGFPSLPLSIVFKNLNITAADSIRKKINFISAAAQTLKLNNITPLCIRIEDIDEHKKNSFDYVVSRAMAELPMLLEYAIPFVKTGGYFIAYKSVKAEEELIKSKNALNTLNSILIDKIEYTLPTIEANKRVLLIIKKEKDISSLYPRKNGIIKKNPL
ncbi:MAG: 16S rRNA (guanine(527)-N(7))-methyltransferase RsmG [Candidatus Gastranaerophilales bacterium]|nr:16S rRNA (guanine(527)-N(7))-methyltransferase RsmG [Candidatus Gastranaerophilales bacterium]